MNRYFHYTTEIRLPEIIDSGLIKLATASIYHKNEKPVAWVSTNQHWENTATKMAVNELGQRIQLTFEQQLEFFGCARIEVKNNNLMTWAKLKHKANMDLRAASGFEFTGKIKGSKPEEWYGSLKPIRINNWINAEVFRNGEWILLKNFNDVSSNS